MNILRKIGLGGKLEIISGLIWASLLLFTSYILKGTEHSTVIFYALLIASSIHLSVLSQYVKHQADEKGVSTNSNTTCI